MDTTLALVTRDLVRFFRQPSRIVGSLLQPLIFWVVIGAGLTSSFRMPGAEGVRYTQYFFPGIVLIAVLFTAIFTTMSVIEDRHRGFLQAVLVGPGSRAALVLGKTLGGVAIALVQAGLMLPVCPLAGFPFAEVAWPALFLLLFLVALGLSSLGFVFAWWLDSTQGYHVVMSALLIPLWILSGAMFPSAGGPRALVVIMRANPLSYALAGLRDALYGQTPGGAALAVTCVFALAALALAARVASHRGDKP